LEVGYTFRTPSSYDNKKTSQRWELETKRLLRSETFSPLKSTAQYRPAIDGLRAVAVLGVFIFHLKHQWLPGGFVGVDVFFVISGYLITSILLREYEHKSFSLWKFYQRRIARLFPAFYTVALATIIAAFFIYSAQDLASCGTGLVSAALSAANLKYMLQGNYFTISPDAQPFLHCWSLSVEEQFYMLFPTILLFLYVKTNRYKTVILGVLCAVSLIACVALTYRNSGWAFYLLPTRAWELMAGSVLADLGKRPDAKNDNKGLWASLSFGGLALVVVSLFAVREGPTFPGYQAILPVLGTVCILGFKGGSGGWAERLLSTGPLVFIGRMSYSLYLWHWPVFCFVDYKLYLASPLVRISLKIALSATCAALSFFLIERPGRVFLNHPSRRRLAFAFLACALLVCVPLGSAVRSTNYIDARMGSIAEGGIAFNRAAPNGSLVLMGDSNGAMYGTMVREVAQSLRLKLNVISVSAGDPLPNSSGHNPQLWLDSLAFIKRNNPDVLVLVCNWAGKLDSDKGRLQLAVDELKHHTRRLVLITQPPELPDSASREAMRDGSRPPFFESPAEHAKRTESNSFLKSFQHDNVTVIDIEPLFVESDGSIRFVNDKGILLYQDSKHLSGAGADLVRAALTSAINEFRNASSAESVGGFGVR
jgi:peptidoglycan/LPS O-acetylase OafA/YrhL